MSIDDTKYSASSTPAPEHVHRLMRATVKAVHTLTTEELPPHTHPKDAGMFASFPGFLFAKGKGNQIPLADDTVAEYILHSGPMPFVEVIIPPGAVKRDLSYGQDPAALAAMLRECERQIKADVDVLTAKAAAEKKAAPVMNAIQAMHRATRSDGRPPLYVDPLRAPDA